MKVRIKSYELRKTLALLLLSLILNSSFLISSCLAQTTVQINLSAVLGLSGSTTTNRTCLVQYLSSPGVNGSQIVIRDIGNFITDTNSTFSFTLPAMGDYRVKVLAPPSADWFQFSVTNMNLGTVANIVPYLTVTGAPTYPAVGATAYTMAASDARYAFQSNVLGSAAFLPSTAFQPASANLTNFAGYPTNSFQSSSSALSNFTSFGTNYYQVGNANLSNWALFPSNTWQSASANLSNFSAINTNYYQPAASTLSNWSQVSTNSVVYQSQIGTAAASSASAFQTASANLTQWSAIGTNAVVYPSQLGNAAYSNSAEFQPANANLTAWSGYTPSQFALTNSLGTAAYDPATFFQPANNNLSNYALYPTNQWQSNSATLSNLVLHGENYYQIGSGVLTNLASFGTNYYQIGNANLSNYALYPTNTWQSNSLNLSNWAQISTNILGTLGGGGGAGPFQPANNVLTNLSTNNAFTLTNLNATNLTGLVTATNLGGVYTNQLTLNHSGNQFWGSISLTGSFPLFRPILLVDGGLGFFNTNEVILCTNTDSSTVIFYSSPSFNAPFSQWTPIYPQQQGLRWTADVWPSVGTYYVALAQTNTPFTDIPILFLQPNGVDSWISNTNTDYDSTGLSRGGWGNNVNWSATNGSDYFDGHNTLRIHTEPSGPVVIEDNNGFQQIGADGGTNVYVGPSNNFTLVGPGTMYGNGAGLSNIPLSGITGTNVLAFTSQLGTAAFDSASTFQPASANLTSFALYPTNSFQSASSVLTNFASFGTNYYQVGSANLSNYSLYPTNTWQPASANLTNFAKYPTNSFQSASATLTNWSAVGTNLVVYSSQLGSAAYSNASAFYPNSNPSNFISSASGFIPQFSGTATNITFAPNSTNILGGKNLFPMWSETTLANGNNAAISIGTNNSIRFTGPTASFTNCGFAGGTNGAWFWAVNGTPQPMTIANDSGNDIAANRIYTATGANITLSNQYSLCLFVYDSVSLHWILACASGQTVFNGYFNGTFTGNGGGLTNLVATGFVPTNVWYQNGNAGNPSGAFLGTTDTKPLQFGINGYIVGRFDENFGGPPNFMVGNGSSGGNSIASLNGNSVLGGYQNTISNLSDHIVIAGGEYNLAGGSLVFDAAIGGGSNNVAYGNAATVPGGANNVATNYSFAAGVGAIATNNYSFVWSDGYGTANSWTTNQFIVHATNGLIASSFLGLQNNTTPLTAAQLGPYGIGLQASNGVLFISFANSSGSAISSVSHIP